MKKNTFFKSIMIASCFILLISMNSCMITKTPVGKYTEQTGEKYRYAKGKQVWLFWGLIPCGRTAVNTPDHGNCMVRTSFTFGDLLIGGLTGGLVTTYSIKVYAKKGNQNTDGNSIQINNNNKNQNQQNQNIEIESTKTKKLE